MRDQEGHRRPTILMKMDPRPPIVYLRPFAADAKEGTPRWLHIETQEEKLASVFADVGPLVAFGKPHEKFPTLGAPRNYVEGDREKALIKLMSRARFGHSACRKERRRVML